MGKKRHWVELPSDAGPVGSAAVLPIICRCICIPGR